MNLFNLNGKIALITGASGEIGSMAAITYAKAGVDVALLGQNMIRLSDTANKVEQEGRKALILQCDITKENLVEKAVQATIDTYGKIDILLNCSGVCYNGNIDSLTSETWSKTFDVNVNGLYYVCKYVVKHMLEAHYGKIINISSVNSLIGVKSGGRHAYNSSKAAVCGLTIGMAASYMSEGITVNAICPGLFHSNMTAETVFKNPFILSTYNRITPAGRPGNPDELNGTIIYLSSDASSYVTGQCIAVDGGYSTSSLI